MPVTFTVIGNALDATIIDSNFDEVDRFMNEQVLGSDMKLLEMYDKYRIRRYEGGILREAIFRENFIYDEGYAEKSNNSGFYELLFRNPLDYIKNGLPDKWSSKGRTMELIGTPGPSMYFEFQEAGEVYSGASDPNRYSNSECYTYWLTVPNCSKKVWISGPCVVRVKAMFYAMMAPSFWGQYIDYGTIIAPWGNTIDSWSNEPDKIGREMSARIALVVDTNPVLYDDEFVNTNPNITVNGIQATHKSWNFITKKSIYAGGTSTKEQISGDITLKGNRYYNFSLKFRDSATIGYVSSGTFYDGTYENSASFSAFNSTYGYVDQEVASAGIFDVMWLAQSLHIEVMYGHGTIYNDSSLITGIEL